jgi:hypothetical protein
MVKERTRGLVCTLPFTHILRQMKIEFIYFMVFWLNAFPVKTGISGVYSPQELLVRWHLDYNKHCRVLPGTYCEVHDEPVPSNTMTRRTHTAIAMGPLGNLQGSVKFICLTTGRILKQREFTPYPMPDQVIKRGNQIGAKENQGRTFQFLNQRTEPYEWTDKVPEDDSEFQGLFNEEEMAPYPDVSAEPPKVELESEESNFQLITDDPEPDFCELAAAALDNAGINPTERIQAARDRVAAVPAKSARPRLVKVNEVEIVYEITFDLPDARLGQNTVPPDAPASQTPSFSSGMSDNITPTSGR